MYGQRLVDLIHVRFLNANPCQEVQMLNTTVINQPLRYGVLSPIVPQSDDGPFPDSYASCGLLVLLAQCQPGPSFPSQVNVVVLLGVLSRLVQELVYAFLLERELEQNLRYCS